MALPNIKNYHFIEKIGEGSYSTVYKASKQDNSKEIVAIKCIEKTKISSSLIDNIITEISLLKNLKHRNIVQMQDFDWDSRYIYIIMEYCNRGDLSNFIKKRRRIPEEICRKFMQQLTLAIKYLHTQQVCHMDLKPQNILLKFDVELVLKLADFGLAKYIPEHERMNTLCGSPLYMAPEIILKKDYDAKVDLWSMGIILYECLFGRAPYSSPDLTTLLSKIKSQSAIEVPPGLSKSCDNFLKGLLKHDPNERFTFEVVFNHPWLDLEHIPSPENFTKGAQFAQKATVADSQGKYQEALDLYCNALSYLGPCVLNEKDPVKKGTIQAKIEQYLSRAEYLKINHTSPVTQSSSQSANTSSSQGSNEKILQSDQVRELALNETKLN